MEARKATGMQHSLRDMLISAQKDGTTFAKIGLATGISRPAISQYVNKGLQLRDEQVAALRAYFDIDERAETPAPAPAAQQQTYMYKNEVELYQTAEYRDAMGWCNYIYSKRRMGVMIGFPGCGKTTILREFARVTTGAHYIECWPSMRMGDLLAVLARAAGISVSGNNYRKSQQIIAALQGRTDIILLFDESEYLRKWDVDKFEVLRKIWDNTQTPVIFAGTPELENVLTRGGGRANLAQLYRRKYEIKLSGIKQEEAFAILRDYNITPEAANMLAEIAVDARHGGMGNFVELLDMALEAANGGTIDAGIVAGAKKYKLMW